jgi:hypothetical protein
MALPCNTCGALVVDFDIHNAWHRTSTSAPSSDLDETQQAALRRMTRDLDNPTCESCMDSGVREEGDGYVDCECKRPVDGEAV